MFVYSVVVRFGYRALFCLNLANWAALSFGHEIIHGQTLAENRPL